MLSINLEGACKFFTGWFLWEEVRFWRGGHARNRALFIISGSERGESGKATRTLVFADPALCPHAVRGDLPQGAGIASQGLHVDENRPISGRLGRSFVRAVVRLLLRSASVTLSVVCRTRHPAAKTRGETVKPFSCPCRQTEATRGLLLWRRIGWRNSSIQG